MSFEHSHLFNHKEDMQAIADVSLESLQKMMDSEGVTDRIGIEIDGGVWTGGRHTRGAGFIRDQEKTNAAAVLGWRVLRFVPADVGSGRLFLVVKQALDASG